jgi:hypothetical protein
MAFNPFKWLNKGEAGTPTPLNRQDLNAAEENIAAQVTSGAIPLPEWVETSSTTGNISPLRYGAKFDGKQVQDAAIEAGTNTVAIPEITAVDAGKVILVGGAGVGGGGLLTTITSASAGSAKLAASAATTVTGAPALYGSDDSAAWAAMFAAMEPGRGYKVQCPFGRSLFNNVSVGSTTSVKGITAEIYGAGRRATFLQPISAEGVKTMIIFNGPGDSTSVGVKLDGSLTCGFDYNDPVIDIPYTQPVLRFQGIQGPDLNHTSRLLGTGTVHKFDQTWCGSFGRSARIQTGRYAVGIEMDDGGSGSPQEDTIHFGLLVHEGNYGVIQRNIASGMDSMVFEQFKSALYTPATVDRNHFGEGKLASEAKEGESTITLEAGQAAAMGYETSQLPAPVCIDFGDHVEVNKVTAVAGDVLTLSQPLRFTHAAARVVMRGTFAISLPSNVQSITIGNGCHLEGHSGAGIMCDSGTLITVQGGLSSCRALVRLCGGAANVKVSRYLMQGSQWIGGALSNIAVEVPAFNTSASLARITVEELEKGVGAEPIVYLQDAGNNATKVPTRIVAIPSGVPQTTINVPTGAAESSSTGYHTRVLEEGQGRWEDGLNGARIWRSDTRMKRRGVGSVVFEYWNGTEWVEAKSVAIGAGEIRFGEDTVLTRAAKQQLETAGQLSAKDGLTTISLEGAGLTTITDGLFKNVPPNGTLAIHLDTTTGRKYMSFRANGAWLLLVNDYDSRGQAGIFVPQALGGRFSTLTAVSGNAYTMRFKATLPFVLKKGVFRLTTKAGSNDTIEIGIFSAAYKLLATSGPLTGLLNGALGFIPVPLEYTLVPGLVYYAGLAFGTLGSTGAVITGMEYASGENAKFFGEGAGIIEYDSHATDAPLPETFVGGGGPITVPALALRQS